MAPRVPTSLLPVVTRTTAKVHPQQVGVYLQHEYLRRTSRLLTHKPPTRMGGYRGSNEMIRFDRGLQHTPEAIRSSTACSVLRNPPWRQVGVTETHYARDVPRTT